MDQWEGRKKIRIRKLETSFTHSFSRHPVSCKVSETGKCWGAQINDMKISLVAIVVEMGQSRGD